MPTTNEKADDLLREIGADPDDICPVCKCRVGWHDLDGFDPPFGKAELTYAEKSGWIERDPNNARWIRITEKGRKRYDKIV